MLLQVVGVILAGGKSRRFGSPKALALLKNRPVIAHVAARLDPLLLAVVGSAKAAAMVRAQFLCDPSGAGAGPLAGIAAGLEWALARSADWLVTAPCDTPLLPFDMAASLVEAAIKVDAPAAVVRTDEGLQPLCAVYRPELQGIIFQAAMTSVHPATHVLLADCGAVEVHFDEVSAFININTQQDYARAEALLGD